MGIKMVNCEKSWWESGNNNGQWRKVSGKVGLRMVNCEEIVGIRMVKSGQVGNQDGHC